jgi:hypothetical protein
LGNDVESFNIDKATILPAPFVVTVKIRPLKLVGKFVIDWSELFCTVYNLAVALVLNVVAYIRVPSPLMATLCQIKTEGKDMMLKDTPPLRDIYRFPRTLDAAVLRPVATMVVPSPLILMFVKISDMFALRILLNVAPKSVDINA